MSNFNTMMNDLKTYQQTPIKDAINFLLLAEQYLEETQSKPYQIKDIIELAKFFRDAQK